MKRLAAYSRSATSFARSGGRGRALAVFAIAIAAIAAVDARAGEPASLAGAWAFETSAHRSTGCVIRGQAVLRPRREANIFDVEMRAAEQCPGGGVFRAEEACVARRNGESVNVSCRLVRATPSNYNADQFALHIESASAMAGRLVDHGIWNEQVRWRRTAGDLVS